MSYSINDKVKLELLQPDIKCSGRRDVSCHYRGEVIDTDDGAILINFKYKGHWVEEWYGLEEDCFDNSEGYSFEDIKLKK